MHSGWVFTQWVLPRSKPLCNYSLPSSLFVCVYRYVLKLRKFGFLNVCANFSTLWGIRRTELPHLLKPPPIRDVYHQAKTITYHLKKNHNTIYIMITEYKGTCTSIRHIIYINYSDTYIT